MLGRLRTREPKGPVSGCIGLHAVPRPAHPESNGRLCQAGRSTQKLRLSESLHGASRSAPRQGSPDRNSACRSQEDLSLNMLLCPWLAGISAKRYCCWRCIQVSADFPHLSGLHVRRLPQIARQRNAAYPGLCVCDTIMCLKGVQSQLCLAA